MFDLSTPVKMAVLGLLLALLLPVAASAELSVDAVRIGKHPDKTRFVVELSESADYSIFTLADPYRVVIDLPELTWNPASAAKTPEGGAINSFRFGLFRPGNFRLVLDLSGPATVDRDFLLPPSQGSGYRLVVDLKRVTRAAFMRGVKSRMAAVPKVRTPRPVVAKPARRADNKKVVIIDAGHGGVDPGTIGVTGRREKDITLAFARELRDRMQRTGRYHVVMTRDRDIFVRLRDRVAKGRSSGGDLFISVHADSIKNRKVRGATVYSLSEKSSDAEAEALANKENRSDIIAGIDLTGESDEVTSILIDLAQRESMNYSATFANTLVPYLRKQAKVRKNAHRFAGFVVLKAPDVPSVLIELGYLSNRQDEKFLSSRRSRGGMVKAIIAAVDHYFQSS